MTAQTTAQAKGDPRPRMLFVRQFGIFTGGHLKWSHYLANVAAHGRFRPLLHVTPDSNTAGLAPLLPPGLARCALPAECEALFLAGLDWDILDQAGQDIAGRPVLNLIQGVRHADPGEPQYAYLSRPATRLCVSQQVADAILATGRVNGPVHVIDNGIDLAALAALRPERRAGGVLIDGLKDRPLGAAVSAALDARGIAHDLPEARLPRSDYLARLANADIAILLPFAQEGFYLPALEAMALGTAVIMPDCVGARGFARDGQSCVITPRDSETIAAAAAALIADPARVAALRRGGADMAQSRTLESERQKLFTLLDRFPA